MPPKRTSLAAKDFAATVNALEGKAAKAWEPGAIPRCPVTGKPDPRPAWAACTDRQWFNYQERACGVPGCATAMVGDLCSDCKLVDGLEQHYMTGEIGGNEVIDEGPLVRLDDGGWILWPFASREASMRFAMEALP